MGLFTLHNCCVSGLLENVKAHDLSLKIILLFKSLFRVEGRWDRPASLNIIIEFRGGSDKKMKMWLRCGNYVVRFPPVLVYVYLSSVLVPELHLPKCSASATNSSQNLSVNTKHKTSQLTLNKTSL